MNIILYTHTDVKDVWKPFFGQTEKYLSAFDKTIIVNKSDSMIPNNYNVVYYDDSKPYRLRLLDGLNKIDDEYILFHHEDMFLYEKPDLNRLLGYVEYLKQSNTRSFIKLIRGGLQTGIPNSKYYELKEIDKQFDYIFAIQPTIWKKSKLIELLIHSEGNTIWEFEVKAQTTCRNRNILGWYVDDGGVQRGKYHWDSKVYPYIATAVVKGKWNLREYQVELGNILKEYNIDYKLRGSND